MSVATVFVCDACGTRFETRATNGEENRAPAGWVTFTVRDHGSGAFMCMDACGKQCLVDNLRAMAEMDPAWAAVPEPGSEKGN